MKIVSGTPNDPIDTPPKSYYSFHNTEGISHRQTRVPAWPAGAGADLHTSTVLDYSIFVKPFVFALACVLPLAADVKVTSEKDRVIVDINGRPFTTLYYGGETMKPYLHPLRAASGTLITRQFPMEKVEGETRDHPHHQGLWFSHGDVNGFDFWGNVRPGPKFGRIVVDKVTKAAGGKTGTVAFEARWIDPAEKAILKETRRMTFSGDKETRTVDVDLTLTALEGPVKFGDTKEGTFAIRIADAMTEKAKGGVLTNAAGATGMKAVWGKPSPWVDYSGKLGDEALGITILDHPSNPKHPSHWHARDYGLFAANIFGEHDYYNDKQRDGSVTVEPGKSIRFRYRVVIHPGDVSSAKAPELFQQYSKTR